MSIQRWYIQNPPGQPTEFVSYADHLAAVAEAEQRARDEIAADGPWFKSVVHQCCEDKQTAYAAGVSAARDAVAALLPRFTQTDGWLMGQEIGAALDAALAAIDALKEKP